MAANGYWHRVQRGRISRRRLLGAAGAGTAGLAVIAATGGGGQPALAGTHTMAGGPRYGGRYQTASAFGIDTLDPHLSIAGGPAYFPRVYNALLVRSVADAQFAFDDLAQAYEQPDETTWIFSIRRGVKIAPNTLGVPERDLDAEDARVSFERIMGLPQANACPFVCEWFASHQVPDPQTYVVNTPSPYAYFLLRIGSNSSTIPPRELIQQNPDRMRQNAVGGGPFFVRPGGYVESQSLILDKNSNYYRTDPDNNNAQLPYIDGMDVSIIPDRAARRTAFISQQSHSYGAENADEADQLLSEYDVYAVREPVYTFISFVMNVKRPPWGDSRVRKAAMYAMNRQQYIDRVYGGDAQANGLVHWPLGAYALPEEELAQLQPFDPQRSRLLIQEAGYELPLRINVMFPANTTIEEHNQHLPIFLEQMAAAGFEVVQDARDFLSWLDNYTEKNYDASLALNQIYETPEWPLGFHHSRGPAGSDIYSNGLQDAEIDAAIEATKEITDPDALVEAIHGVQRQISAKGPVFLPIVSPFSRTLYWSFVRNIPQGLGAAGQFLSNWWLELGPAPTATPTATAMVQPTATSEPSLPETGTGSGSGGGSTGGLLVSALAGGGAAALGGVGALVLGAVALRLRMRRR